MRIGSLFTGAGMLDVGVQMVLGGSVAWHCEIELAASRVLEHRWPDVPNLGDITAVDWASVEPVDVLTAGYPCQPFSDAGRQQGEDDARYLWPEVARAIGALGPRLVVLENVRGHVVRGFPRVVGELADLGYDARWTVVPASAVGAPHPRERLFVAAYPHGRGRRGRGWTLEDATDAAEPAHSSEAPTDARHGTLAERARPTRREGGERPPERAEPRRNCEAPTDSDHGGSRGSTGRLHRGIAESDAAGGSGQTDWGDYRAAIERWAGIVGRHAPIPSEPNTKGGRRLAPAFAEWMMGWPAGWVTDLILPDADPRPNRISRSNALRIIGNGVVPQQAAYALELLLSAELRSAVA